MPRLIELRKSNVIRTRVITISNLTIIVTRPCFVLSSSGTNILTLLIMSVIRTKQIRLAASLVVKFFTEARVVSQWFVPVLFTPDAEEERLSEQGCKKESLFAVEGPQHLALS